MLALPLRPWLLAAIVLLTPALSLTHLALAGSAGLQLESERELVRAYQALEADERPLYYLDHLPVSAAFYTRGSARAVPLSAPELALGGHWLAVHKNKGNRPPTNCQATYSPATGEFDLYYCNDQKPSQ